MVLLQNVIQGILTFIAWPDVQRFLTGPDGLLWRPIDATILWTIGEMGFNCALFFYYGTKLDINGLSYFYCSVFKAWMMCLRHG